MKKPILIALIILMLTVCTSLHAPALAAHDDFDITYTVEPSRVGYKGADVNIGIRVQNTGSTNITGFEVSVTTMAGYSQRWTGTIAPGTTRPTIVFTVPFAQADLDADKLLYVKIENDGDGDYNDGTQVRTFQVAGTAYIFDIGWSVSPDLVYYIVGDTVTITHTFRNTFDANAATGVQTREYLSLDGNLIYTVPIDSHGIVMPGETVSTTFDYTFAAADVGHMRASCNIYFGMMGEDYEEGRWTLEYDVREPLPLVEFTARLSAVPTTIDAGDEVTFTVSLENTGGGSIGRFEVHNAEGGLEAATEPMPAGASGTTSVTSRIYESTEVSFVVVGISSAGSVSQETNSVRITVREPEASPSPSPSPTDAAAPTATSIATPAPSPGTSPTLSGAPSIEAEVAATDDPLADSADVSAETNPAPSSTNPLLYIIIGILGLLVLAGAIAIPLILKKRKRNKTDTIRKNNEL